MAYTPLSGLGCVELINSPDTSAQPILCNLEPSQRVDIRDRSRIWDLRQVGDNGSLVTIG